jgi:PIN domain nuclease of toxin-antitoxin system
VSRPNIIDASAILAYLQQETGQEIVESALDAGPSWISAVNYCEILGKLHEKGMPLEEAQAAFNDLGLIVVDFDSDLARRAAELRVRTKPIGASLTDRACLALAQRTAEAEPNPIVFTAERSWAKLKWPFRIVLIRSAKNNA